MGHRNKILHLLGMYELLLEGRQTFYSIRQELRMGYNSLKSLLDTLISEELVIERIIDETRYYEYTEKLIELFEGKFYDGIKKLEDDII